MAYRIDCVRRYEIGQAVGNFLRAEPSTRPAQPAGLTLVRNAPSVLTSGAGPN
jgi:hypothetical protein